MQKWHEQVRRDKEAKLATFQARLRHRVAKGERERKEREKKEAEEERHSREMRRAKTAQCQPPSSSLQALSLSRHHHRRPRRKKATPPADHSTTCQAPSSSSSPPQVGRPSPLALHQAPWDSQHWCASWQSNTGKYKVERGPANRKKRRSSKPTRSDEFPPTVWLGDDDQHNEKGEGPEHALPATATDTGPLSSSSNRPRRPLTVTQQAAFESSANKVCLRPLSLEEHVGNDG